MTRESHHRERMRAVDRSLAAVVIAAVALGSIGCNPGLYPIDIFPEMHRQEWHRPLEPERPTAPEGAVPSTTNSRPWPREPVAVPAGQPLITFEQASQRENPVPDTPDQLRRGFVLYQTNCAACHGAAGRGDGPLQPYFLRSGAYPPTDFASARVRERSDGELHWLLTYGIAGMPPYGQLLTDEERWLLVRGIRSVQGQ